MRKPSTRTTEEKRQAKRQADKRYAIKHAKKIQEYQAQWRADHVEERREYARNYHQEHAEEICERSRVWYAGHPTQGKESRSAYRKTHHAEKAASDKKRKALKRGASESTLTDAQWRMIKAHYGNRCVYCGKKSTRLSQDHIIPLAKGGAHTLHNVVPACISCNARKHAGPPPVPVQPLLL